MKIETPRYSFEVLDDSFANILGKLNKDTSLRVVRRSIEGVSSTKRQFVRLIKVYDNSLIETTTPNEEFRNYFNDIAFSGSMFFKLNGVHDYPECYGCEHCGNMYFLEALYDHSKGVFLPNIFTGKQMLMIYIGNMLVDAGFEQDEDDVDMFRLKSSEEYRFKGIFIVKLFENDCMLKFDIKNHIHEPLSSIIKYNGQEPEKIVLNIIMRFLQMTSGEFFIKHDIVIE